MSDKLELPGDKPASAARAGEDQPIPIHEADEPISLAEEATAARTQMRAFGPKAAGEGKLVSKFKRPLNPDPHGARRLRLFHSRIAPAPLSFMENQINEWVDNEAIDVKHVGHVIGVMEGKTHEPNLIVLVWY